MSKQALFQMLHRLRKHKLIRWGWRLGAVLLALMLVLYIGLLQLFSRADEFRPRVEQGLSQALGAPVTLQRLDAGWKGLKPDIRLRELRIRHPNHPDQTLLLVPHVLVEPSLRQTLLKLELSLDVNIQGVSLTLQEPQPGQWRLRELSALPAGTPESRRRAIAWILQQGEWRIQHSRLEIQPHGKPVLAMENLTLTNRNGGSRHRLRLRAELAGRGTVQAMADMRAADVLDPLQWSGSSYLSLPAGPWEAWLPPELEGVRPQQAHTAARLWTEWANGVPRSGYVRLEGRQLAAEYRAQPYRITDFKLDADLRRSADGWDVAFMPLQGAWDGQAFPFRTIRASRHADRYGFSVQALHMQGAAVLASRLPLPASVKDAVRQLQPSGYLTGVAATLLRSGEDWTLDSLKADVRQLSWSATDTLPGAVGVNGWVRFEQGKGAAGLRMQKGVLDLRQTFREPTAVESLEGRFVFERTAEAWRIRSDRILVSNAHAQGEAVLGLWIPRAHPERARLQLVAGLRNGRVDSAWRYVPWPSAGDETLAWLKSALREGVIQQGDFLYEGPLVDQPGEPPSVMQMRFALQDATLAYAPGWPEIRKLQAVVTINNRHLQVRARQGQVYDSLARHVVADIPELRNPVLRIEADIDSTGDDVFRLFRESPLREESGRMAELLSVKGEIAGRLNMVMPLADTAKVHVAVDAELPGNPVLVKDAGPFDLWLNGHVRYETGQGLTSKPMTGFFLGQPLNVRFRSVLDEGNVVAVQIQSDGLMTPGSLKPWLGPLTQHMHGSTRFTAFLAVPVQVDAPVHLSVDSDLSGWHMLLPEPFAKKGEPLPLHFEMQLGGQENLAFLTLRNRLQSQFAISGNRIVRALVQLGEGRAGEMPPRGLWVRGHLGQLDIDPWLPWLRPKPGRREVTEDTFPPLHSFTLSVDRLTAGGYTLAKARLGIEPDEDHDQRWRVQLESPDIAGEARISTDTRQPVVALTLYRLVLPLPSQPASGRGAGMAVEWELPPVNVDIRQLSYRDWPGMGTGTLTALVRPRQQGLRVDNLLLKHEGLTLAGRLDWNYAGLQDSRFDGSVKVGDIANLFSAFRYPPVVNSESGEATVSLAWPGAPSDLKLAGLKGEVDVSLTKGRILKLNRTVSLSRLFGVLDTDNLKRRLQLDFSDITRKGMAYDQFGFDAVFQSGVMSNRLSMSSPSMTVTGAGTVDLASNALDQQVQIAVPLVSAVPLAAALVAGPVVGGALVAAETVFDESLRKMTAFNYSITGDWDNPVVERVKRTFVPWRKPVAKPAGKKK